MNRNKAYPLYAPVEFRDLRVLVDQSAKNHGDKYALSYKNNPRDEEVQHITYKEFRNYVYALGTEEILLGLTDQKCAIVGACTLGWIASYFSLMSMGAVTVPLDKEMPEHDLAATMKRASVKAVFYGEEAAARLPVIRAESGAEIFVCIHGEKAPDGENDYEMSDLIHKGEIAIACGNTKFADYKIDPDRMASIVFTSGTTGKGKGVMLSQTNIVSDMTQGMYNFAISPKSLIVLPLHHTFGSTVNLVGHFSQGTTLYISSGIRYLAKEMVEQELARLKAER